MGDVLFHDDAPADDISRRSTSCARAEAGMSAARCHCCGGVPDIHDTSPRYCHVCRDGCKLVATATILRCAACPFLNGRKPPAITVPPPKSASAPERAQRALGTKIADDSFEWRGRVRRNVPGG